MEVSMNIWTDLSDQAFKMYEYIKFYNAGSTSFYVPAAEYLMLKLDKSRASVFRALAELREKGLIQ